MHTEHLHPCVSTEHRKTTDQIGNILFSYLFTGKLDDKHHSCLWAKSGIAAGFLG